MSTFDEQLKQLQAELQKSEEGITKANTNLSDAQNEVKRLTTTKTALQRAIDEITAGQEAIYKQREVAAREKDDAKKSCAGTRAQLEGLLSQEHRDSIIKAIESVDKEISDQRKKASDLKQQVANTTQTVTNAKEEMAKCEASLREIQAELKILPVQIASLQSRVVTLKADAQKAADDGRASEAYIRVTDLERALDELQALVDSQKETDLRNSLVKLGDELAAWNDKASQAIAELDQLKRDQAAAEKQYQASARERDEAIKKKLAESTKVLA